MLRASIGAVRAPSTPVKSIDISTTRPRPRLATRRYRFTRIDARVAASGILSPVNILIGRSAMLIGRSARNPDVVIFPMRRYQYPGSFPARPSSLVGILTQQFLAKTIGSRHLHGLLIHM